MDAAARLSRATASLDGGVCVESEPEGASFPYAAFKQMRPNDEPAFGVEELYYQLYMLAIGLQMAGPRRA